MFRAEIYYLGNDPFLKMEGKLVGPWAEEARSLVMKTPVPKPLIVDVTEVSYVDAVGERILGWFSSIGAVFVARTIYAAAICEQLRLPLAKGQVEDGTRSFSTKAGEPILEHVGR